MRWFLWPSKIPQQPSGRLALSWILAGLEVIFAVIHAFNFLVYPANPTTVKIVAYIQSLGPIWVDSYGFTAVLLIVALCTRRLLAFSHACCAAVWSGYAAALWLGALSDRPTGVISFPIVTTLIMIIHIVLGLASVDTRR